MNLRTTLSQKHFECELGALFLLFLLFLFDALLVVITKSIRRKASCLQAQKDNRSSVLLDYTLTLAWSCTN